jgi:hypothetical protein
VIAIFAWFLVRITNQSNTHLKEQATLFQQALDKVVEKIGDRLDRIEDELIRIKE